MGRGFGFKPLVLILSLVSSMAFGAGDDPEAGWTKTKTDYGLILLFTNQIYPCNASAANFLGCVHLINGLGKSTTPKYALIPKDRIANTPGLKAEVVMTYKKGALESQLVLARIDAPADAPATPRALAEKLKREAAELKQAAASDFNNNMTMDFDVTAFELLKHRSPAISLQRAVGQAVNSLILVQDGHGHLDPLEYLVAKMNNADENFVGIGAVLKPAGKQVAIVKLVDGSPSLTACDKEKNENCLKAKDVIAKIDGVETSTLTFDEVVRRIRGKEQTVVSLEVNRKNEIIPIQITRGPVVVPNVSYKEVNHFGAKVVQISIKEFDKKTCEDVNARIKKMPSDTKGIILDLRNDRGGRLDAAICVGGLFVGKKVIVGVRPVVNSMTVDQLKKMTSPQDKVTDLPVVVLINEVSASASEIVSGALQDYKRGLLLGTRTFGKATVQDGKPWDLVPDLMRFETTARFYMPSDRTNQIVGISPDLEVYPLPDLTEDEKFSLREAELVPSALPPVGAEWIQSRPDVIAKVQRECFTGRSEALLPTLEDDGDYQVLKAEEVLNCDAGVAAAASSVAPSKSASTWVAPTRN